MQALHPNAQLIFREYASGKNSPENIQNHPSENSHFHVLATHLGVELGKWNSKCKREIPVIAPYNAHYIPQP